MEQDLEVREPAPESNLPAAGSARRISLKEASGRSLGLIFHLQDTAPTAREINRALRARYPSTENVLIAGFTDLCIAPLVYWMTVGMVLNTAYERTTEEIPPEMDPAEYAINGPDYGGFVSRRYGVRSTCRAAAIVVIDEDSNRAGAYPGRAANRGRSGDVGDRMGYPMSVRDDSHKRLPVAD